VKVKLFPQTRKCDRLAFFAAATVKLQEFVISKQDKVHHQRRVATDTPVKTNKLNVLRRHDVSVVTTCKEYLINSQILSEYLKLVFL